MMNGILIFSFIHINIHTHTQQTSPPSLRAVIESPP